MTQFAVIFAQMWMLRVMHRREFTFFLVLAALLVIQVHSDCVTNATMAELYRDSFCNLPRNVGSCKLKWKRFYFNRITRHCEPFIYEGCTSNRNNFKTEADCVACCLS